jgi:hypothetical protein
MAFDDFADGSVSRATLRSSAARRCVGSSRSRSMAAAVKLIRRRLNVFVIGAHFPAAVKQRSPSRAANHFRGGDGPQPRARINLSR